MLVIGGKTTLSTAKQGPKTNPLGAPRSIGPALVQAHITTILLNVFPAPPYGAPYGADAFVPGGLPYGGAGGYDDYLQAGGQRTPGTYGLPDGTGRRYTHTITNVHTHTHKQTQYG